MKTKPKTDDVRDICERLVGSNLEEGEKDEELLIAEMRHRDPNRTTLGCHKTYYKCPIPSIDEEFVLRGAYRGNENIEH